MIPGLDGSFIESNVKIEDIDGQLITLLRKINLEIVECEIDISLKKILRHLWTLEIKQLLICHMHL